MLCFAETSTLPYAQFQALTAIRDVTLRTWSTLNATHIDEVQRFLLQHVLTKWNRCGSHQKVEAAGGLLLSFMPHASYLPSPPSPPTA